MTDKELLDELPLRKFDNGIDEVLLLTHKSDDFDNSETHELAGLKPGSYKPHIHDNANSQITVLAGKGIFKLEDEEISYEKGSRIFVPAGTPHGLEVEEPTWLFTIQDNPILDEKNNADFRYA